MPAEARSSKIRALIVDDEPLARANLAVLLRRDPEIESVDECGSGAEAIGEMRIARPDLLFEKQIRPCDPHLTDGLGSRPALVHALNLRISAQQHGKIRAGQRFVIHNQRADLRRTCLGRHEFTPDPFPTQPRTAPKPMPPRLRGPDPAGSIRRHLHTSSAAACARSKSRSPTGSSPIPQADPARRYRRAA